MGCCDKDLKSVVIGLGLDEKWVDSVSSKWGMSILSVLSKALTLGFSISLIVEIIEKLGPLVLSLIVGFLSKYKSKGMTDDDFFDEVLLEETVKRYLPVLIERYPDEAGRIATEWLKEKII